MTKRKRKAFTLIELLLVLVILAILGGIAVSNFGNRTEDARKTAAKTDITTLEGALDLFQMDNGRYPSSEEGLSALMQAPANANNWKGPYLKRAVVNDPWGHPYVYRYPGQQNANSYDVYSMGPDGVDGNDDITNW